MVGPTYQPVPVALPDHFKSPAATQPAASSLPAAWWKLYEDDELRRLVQTAIDSNQDIQQAMARVDQARALARVAGSFILPTVTGDPAFTRSRTTGNGLSAVTGQHTRSVTFNQWTIPVDLTYEIDVWGRVRRSYESATAQATASAYDEAVVRLTVQTSVAQIYYAIRTLDSQAEILNRTVLSYEEQVRLVGAQLKAGLISPVDLYQAQALLDSTRAQARDVVRARADQEHALAILCGQPPAVFTVARNPLTKAAAPQVPAGLPGDVLRRRPDIAEAEQNVMAANASVGVATANFYPTFMLTGSAGFESVDLQHVLDWKSRIATLGPSISVPLFEGGRLEGNLEAAKAQYRQAVAGYVLQVLIAYGDVEDALTDLRVYTEEVEDLGRAVKASEEYLRVATVQYKQGLVNYLVVIDAERTLLGNQLSLAQALNLQTEASIHLIKALGGGWENKQVGK
jgi:outer membrane protein, multidrug efflux system